MYVDTVKGVFPGMRVDIPTCESERKVAFKKMLMVLRDQYEMSSDYVYNFEEVILFFSNKRLLPIKNNTFYKEVREAYETLSKTPNKSTLPQPLKDLMMDTTVCPRALFIRLNVIFVDENNPTLPSAGHYERPSNYPAFYLTGVAYSLGIAPLVGASWGRVIKGTRGGSYVHSMIALYDKCYAKLKQFHFDFEDPATQDRLIGLMGAGRIKAKTMYQDSLGNYQEGERDIINQKRELYYYTGLDEFLKIGYLNYQAGEAARKSSPMSFDDFTVRAGRLLKFVTEYCITDFPLPSSRLRLTEILSGLFQENPLQHYTRILGGLLYYGVLTLKMLAPYQNYEQILSEAIEDCRQRIQAGGMAVAEYISTKDKYKRMEKLKLLESDFPCDMVDKANPLYQQGSRQEDDQIIEEAERELVGMF